MKVMTTMIVLCAAPFSNLYSDKKWEHFLFQSEAFIRLGELLIQKANDYTPGEAESKASLATTYSLFKEARTALQENYEELEAKHPYPSRLIEVALNIHANQIMVNDAKISEVDKDLFLL